LIAANLVRFLSVPQANRALFLPIEAERERSLGTALKYWGFRQLQEKLGGDLDTFAFSMASATWCQGIDSLASNKGAKGIGVLHAGPEPDPGPCCSVGPEISKAVVRV